MDSTALTDLYARGDFAGMERVARQLLRTDPASVEARVGLGMALHRQGDLGSAEMFLKQSFAVDPQHTPAYRSLANLFRDLQRADRAWISCRRAVSIDPNDADAHNILGMLARDRGDVVSTFRGYARSITLAPSASMPTHNLGLALYDAQQFEHARLYFDRSGIGNAGPRSLCCSYKLGELSRFRRKIAQLLARPHISPLVANLSAHHAINFGQPDLYDFCRQPMEFVYREMIDELASPNGLRNDLLQSIRTTEMQERLQPLLRRGKQSAGHLFQRPEASYRRLIALIQSHISAYYERFKAADCVFMQAFPPVRQFASSWYISMRRGGHLTSHIHESGWLSGVVYLSVPERHGESLEGSILFSMDGDNYPTSHADFPSRTVPVDAGDIVLFPSSLFHRTVPFESSDERICIAFDIAPREFGA